MEGKRTPGPWVAAGCAMGNCGEIPLERGGNMQQLANSLPTRGFPVIAVRDMGDDMVQMCLVGLAVSTKDAHLIASAPELLAACEALLVEWEAMERVHGEHGGREVAMARAAIANAKGEDHA